MIRRAADWFLIVAFAAALWAPIVAKRLQWGAQQDLQENRVLAERPHFHSTPLAAIPKKMDAFLRDRFPFRSQFVHGYAMLVHRYLGLSSPVIMIGKDGWLFHDLDGCQSADYMGRAPFSAAQLVRWRTFLEARRQYLAARGIGYLFVIAPNQSTVYPEMLPWFVRGNKGTSRREQFLQSLSQDSRAAVLDLSDPLREAKSRGRVYYTNDPHWNGLGCQTALEAICRRLQPWCPQAVESALAANWQLEAKPMWPGMWYMLGLADVQVPPELFLVRRHSSPAVRFEPTLPSNWPPIPAAMWNAPRAFVNARGRQRLLVLGDSFSKAGTFDPFDRPLADLFARSLFIVNGCDRNTHAQLDSLLAQEHPDVVVEETAEWNLAAVPPSEAMAPAVHLAQRAAGVASAR